MHTFEKSWSGKRVADTGAYMSKEATSFVRAFRNMLKRQLEPEGIEVELKPNHYDCSGFLRKDDKYIYISYSIPRGGYPIDFDACDAMNGVLYRTAKNERDFRGGNNHFSSLNRIARDILKMFDEYERYN